MRLLPFIARGSRVLFEPLFLPLFLLLYDSAEELHVEFTWSNSLCSPQDRPLWEELASLLDYAKHQHWLATTLSWLKLELSQCNLFTAYGIPSYSFYNPSVHVPFDLDLREDVVLAESI